MSSRAIGKLIVMGIGLQLLADLGILGILHGITPTAYTGPSATAGGSASFITLLVLRLVSGGFGEPAQVRA